MKQNSIVDASNLYFYDVNNNHYCCYKCEYSCNRKSKILLHDCVKRQKLSLTRNTVEKAPEISPGIDENIQNNENYPKNNHQINKK